MDTKFAQTATWGAGWQKNEKWEPHTAGPHQASIIANGYIKWLKVVAHWTPKGEGIDIGSGAGYLAAAFQKHGIQMTASEWNEDGLALIHKLNPDLPLRQVNILDFHDKEAYDFIFGRELYPFTRTNSFTDQHAAISNIIDALKPGGVLVLIGSEVSHPHCADWHLLIKTFRKDHRLAKVSSRYLEPLISRHQYFLAFGKLSYWLAIILLSPLLAYKKYFCRNALIGAIAFRKK